MPITDSTYYERGKKFIPNNNNLNTEIPGVPSVVSESSLAYEVGSKMGKWLSKPERHVWLNRLCYTEWYADEIHTQWRRLRNRI